MKLCRRSRVTEKTQEIDGGQGAGTRRKVRYGRSRLRGSKRDARQKETNRMSQILAASTAAPDFKLRVTPDQRLSLSDLKGRPVILAFYPADWSPVCGDQMALYNEVVPESANMALSCWEFRWTARGATRPSPRTATCIFRYWRTSTPRVRSRRATELIGKPTASASVRCSSSTTGARSSGVTAPRSPSIPAPTVSLRHWKTCQAKGRMVMATLRVPVTQHDHIRGPANAPV